MGEEVYIERYFMNSYAPVNGSFRRLAGKYQVKTLESLNRAASEDLTADKMAITLAFNFKPGTHPLPYAVFLYKPQFY